MPNTVINKNNLNSSAHFAILSSNLKSKIIGFVVRFEQVNSQFSKSFLISCANHILIRLACIEAIGT